MGSRCRTISTACSHALNSDSWLNQRGGIFLLYADQMGEADRTLLVETAARVVLDSADGRWRSRWSAAPTAILARFAPLCRSTPGRDCHADPRAPDRSPIRQRPGRFQRRWREYVIYLRPGETTPAPWINVIANADFGFLVSETGGGLHLGDEQR